MHVEVKRGAFPLRAPRPAYEKTEAHTTYSMPQQKTGANYAAPVLCSCREA
ncbi:MAG: hypothetical protein ACJA0Y_000898 [Maricaulis maris]|jgi:hypothetical protein